VRNALVVTKDVNFLDACSAFLSKKGGYNIKGYILDEDGLIRFIKKEGNFDLVILDTMRAEMDKQKLCLDINIQCLVATIALSSWGTTDGFIRKFIPTGARYMSFLVDFESLAKEIERIEWIVSAYNSFRLILKTKSVSV
jgi:DNA-binding response OmpR family regulator